MMLVRSVLKYSPIHGIGCFADEDIKKGQVVWRFDPGLDVIINEEDLGSYPSTIAEFLKIYGYGQLNGDKKEIVLCGDHGRHMNHSDDPNLIEEIGLYNNVAVRDIKKGEELTCDYNQFDLNASHKLG